MAEQQEKEGIPAKDAFFGTAVDLKKSEISPNFCLNFHGSRRGKPLGKDLEFMELEEMSGLTRKSFLRLSLHRWKKGMIGKWRHG